MSNALDHVRHNCGIAGEEVAEMVDELEQQRDELLAELERAQKWIAHRGNGLPDHACAQCVPHSDILIEGFVCAYHTAIAKVKP